MGETSAIPRATREPRDDLYFIQAASGPIKIGRGKDPQKRLQQCRIGSHERLEIIATLKGRGYEEPVWHTAFGNYRIRGEWFDDEADLRDAIALAH